MSDMLYKEYLIHWLQRKQKLVKASTYANYSLKIMNHLYEGIGNVALKDLDEKTLQQQVFVWLEKGACQGGGGLKLKTVKDLVTLVRSSLRDAARENLRANAALEIVYPRSYVVGEKEILTEADQRKLATYVFKHPTPHNIGILLALATGMRIGEICALRWEHIDLEQRTVIVRGTLARIYGRNAGGQSYNEVVISAPKTVRSLRTIPLTKKLCELLQQEQVEVRNAYLLSGKKSFVEPSNYRSYFYKLTERLGIKHINFHGLRHTFASSLIGKGVDCKTVSELLGHANVNLTFNIYVHSSLLQKRKAVELLKY